MPDGEKFELGPVSSGHITRSEGKVSLLDNILWT